MQPDGSKNTVAGSHWADNTHLTTHLDKAVGAGKALTLAARISHVSAGALCTALQLSCSGYTFALNYPNKSAKAALWGLKSQQAYAIAHHTRQKSIFPRFTAFSDCFYTFCALGRFFTPSKRCCGGWDSAIWSLQPHTAAHSPPAGDIAGPRPRVPSLPAYTSAISRCSEIPFSSAHAHYICAHADM